MRRHSTHPLDRCWCKGKNKRKDFFQTVNICTHLDVFFQYNISPWVLPRAQILKHFIEVEKITFRLKRYLSNNTCIFGILKHTSCLSRRMTSTAAFSPEPEFLDIYWRRKSQLFEKTRLFKDQGVQQGSFWQQFLCVDCKDYCMWTVKEENR